MTIGFPLVMMTEDKEGDLLSQLSTLSTKIYNNYDPHNPHIYLERVRLYARLSFSDLAAADAYRSLTLLECVVEPESAEYVARRRVASVEVEGEEDDKKEEVYDDGKFIDVTFKEYMSLIGETYLVLVQSLVRIGCLCDAFEFRRRAAEQLSALAPA